MAVFISACQQEFPFSLTEAISLEDGSEPLDLSTARAYYKELKAQYGDHVNMDLYRSANSPMKVASGKEIPNRKHVLFKKGFQTETQRSMVIEFPVVYNQRFTNLFFNKEENLDAAMKQEIFQASFDRLVIVRDKASGKMTHRLITFIPDIDYLRSENNDISHNHINNLDSDFSGYLVYKNWEDDQPLYYLRYEDGKKLRYSSLKQTSGKRTASSGEKASAQGSVSPMYLICWTEVEEIWGDACVSTGPEGDEYTHCEPYLISSEEYEVCVDMGDEEDPCIEWGDCGTGDPCIDWGDCDDPGPCGYSRGDCAITEAEISASLDTTMSADFYANERIRCIFQKLMQNNFFKKKTNGFTNQNSAINLHFKLGPLPSNPGTIKHGDAKANPLQWYAEDVDVTLNSNYINQMSSLEIAATLLHEGIHAEMYRYLLSIQGPSNLTNVNFPTLYNFYSQYKGDQSPQHQAMAAHYISVMGSALHEYDGAQFSIQHYKSLAWEGLGATDAYNALSATEKQDINSKVNELLANRQTSNCND